ncbi:glycosyltransferase family 8 protein [Entomospira culicis]|uniref:Glycosyltransferase family 8 protein n=1 Tax=Entomospira culicis TaxID=2719989 RepID=A0A968GJ39_9SPIO|nr:glycosyltransferase family 8 protein [Entomospira culicis]NIZ19670.1 glycosyltransferase family 8 protein [Entomospira culicis]NIZ69884.1 glycosyltransferase family 8 protein [Entomospira culicis]WDI36989.1 glycosyltransferase family 8 protein [Entomospira culicis]WDI38618.1 glycosyltransferase family 8 protein [Entomospira culicis]
MQIPVVLAINDAYLQQAKVLIYSLYDNAKEETRYDVYILHYKLSLETQEALEIFYKKENFRGRLTFLGMSEAQWQSIPFVGKWGKETNYRLFLPNLLPHLDKIIYLDADVLVLADLTEYYALDLKETAFGSVIEDILAFRRYYVFTQLAKLDKQHMSYQADWEYINAGILFLNLKKLRAIDLEEKALRLLSLLPKSGFWLEHFRPPHIDPLIMPDQDILFYLAFAYTDGITYVPFAYNYLLFVLAKSQIENEASAEYEAYLAFLNRRVPKDVALPSSPVMIHFAAMHPWKVLHMKGRYADRYHVYAKKIGWNSTKYSYFYFLAKVRNYIKHRLLLPDFKEQMRRVFKRV